MLDFKEQLMAIKTEMNKDEEKDNKLIEARVEVKDIDTNRQIKQVKIEVNTNDKLHSNIDKGVVINNINTKSSNKILVKRGQVFWADLGINNQGSEQNGIRPILIIQNDVGNIYSPTTIVAVITSKMTKAKLPTHIALPKGIYEGMPQDSVILFEQIRTLDKRRLHDKVCQLDELTMHKIDKAIGTSLGITVAEPVKEEKIEVKTPLEKLSQETQSYITNKLRFIETCKNTIELYQMVKGNNNSIDWAEDEKFKEENALMSYCDKNNINYNEICNCYIEIREGADNKTIAL